MNNLQIEKGPFTLEAGMKPEDVIKSNLATDQQKKLAHIFDADGIEGYSQREANIFNATTITDNGNEGFTLCTTFADGSKKSETIGLDVVQNYKYSPDGDIKQNRIKKYSHKTSTYYGRYVDKVDIVFDNKGDTLSYSSYRRSGGDHSYHSIEKRAAGRARVEKYTEKTSLLIGNMTIYEVTKQTFDGKPVLSIKDLGKGYTQVITRDGAEYYYDKDGLARNKEYVEKQTQGWFFDLIDEVKSFF